jgi:penicillin-binding protein 1C
MISIKRYLAMFNVKIFHTLKKVPTKLKKRAFWKKTGIAFGVCMLVGLVFGVGMYIYFAKDLPSIVDLENRRLIQSSKIYDRTGEVLLYEVTGDENRTVIPTNEMPEQIKEAFIAIEDREFYSHIGVRPVAITRAAFQNITGRGVGGGASTITQQFVKNAILTNEQTLTRKVREAILAIQLETQYSKDEIIAFYLNEIPFGSNLYGVEAASQAFFAKPARDIDLHEAAMLAAIVQRPSYYSPYGSNFKELKGRQEYVLTSMQELGYISVDEMREAQAAELKIKPYQQNIIAPHFVFYVQELLAKELGEDVLKEGGLQIRTTLDVGLQKIGEQVLKDNLDSTQRRFDTQNGALAAIDPNTGQILTMVGSKNYFDTENDGNVNVLVTPQSPGSSIKPIVYAAAMERGYNSNTVVFDLPTNFGSASNPYEPNNFNLQFNGPVSFKRALANSLNIPAVKALYLAGIDYTLDIAYKLGITDYSTAGNSGLAMALGGKDLKLVEHIGAFGAFPNNGTHHKISPILEVTNQKGERLLSYTEQSNQAISAQTARMVTDILSDNAARAETFGFTNDLTVPGVQSAAKTGTSQEFRDALTVGYTRNLVAGVWVGKNDNSPMRNGADGSVVAAPIWNDFMKEAVKLIEPGTFDAPEPIVSRKPMVNGKFEQTETVRMNRITGKLASEQTPPELIEEREFKKVHSILYYVFKEDPNGEYPKRPQEDPQFNAWEGPVRAWAERNGYNIAPPKEEDNVYTDELRPQLTIKTPSMGQTITTETFTLDISASAPNGLKQIDVYLNGGLVRSLTSAPYSVDLTTPVDKGEHSITIRAFDTNLHRAEQSISFTSNVVKDEAAPTIQSFNVNGNASTGFTLVAQVIDSSGVERVDFFHEVAGRISRQGPKDANKNVWTFSYTPDSKTDTEYVFYVQAVDAKGNISTSEKLRKRP